MPCPSGTVRPAPSGMRGRAPIPRRGRCKLTSGTRYASEVQRSCFRISSASAPAAKRAEAPPVGGGLRVSRCRSGCNSCRRPRRIRCGARDLEHSAPDMAPLLPIRCTTPNVGVATSGACSIRCGARDLERSTPDIAPLLPIRCTAPDVGVATSGVVLNPVRCTGSGVQYTCLLYTSPSPRDQRGSRMPSSA